MCTSGIGTWPKNALRASQSSTVLSFPIDQSMRELREARVRLAQKMDAAMLELIEVIDAAGARRRRGERGGTHDWLLHSSSQASTWAPVSSSVRRPVSSVSSGCTGAS